MQESKLKPKTFRLAARILANFPEFLTEDQKVKDSLAELRKISYYSRS